MLTKEKFDIVEQNIKKLNGKLIWIEFSKKEVEFNKTDNLKIFSISTIALKNKLVFKLYENEIQADALIHFINQVADLFPKNLYIIYNTQNFKFTKEVNEYIFDSHIKIIEY